MAADNFAEFIQMRANRIQAKWRRVANNIDRWCRFTDNYMEGESAEMSAKLEGMQMELTWPEGFFKAFLWFLECTHFLIYLVAGTMAIRWAARKFSHLRCRRPAADTSTTHEGSAVRQGSKVLRGPRKYSTLIAEQYPGRDSHPSEAGHACPPSGSEPSCSTQVELQVQVQPEAPPLRGLPSAELPMRIEL
eukprot:6282289-Prymnesium_polylepis.1